MSIAQRVFVNGVGDTDKTCVECLMASGKMG